MLNAGVNIFRSNLLAVPGALPPPNYSDVIQWALIKDIYQDPSTKNWFLPDKRGDQLRDLHKGSFINFNGTDNNYNTNVPASVDKELYVEARFKSLLGIQVLIGSTSGFYIGSVNGKIAISHGGGGSDTGVVVDLNKHTFYLDKDGNFYYDGVFVFQDANAVSSTSNIYVGSLNNNSFYANADIFLAKINENEICYACYDYEDYTAGSLNPLCQDKSENGNNGTINGTIDANTRQESIEVECFRNTNGYNVDGLKFIPRLETPENIALPLQQQLDVLGNPLQFYGRARYDIQAINNNIATTDGTHTITFPDLSGVTIVDFGGTATPSKNGNDIEWTVGTIFYLELSDGTFIPFQTGDGLSVFDTFNGIQYLINGSSTGLWGNSNTVYPYDFINGFDLWQNDSTLAFKYVPFKQDGTSILTDGDTIAGYTWVSRNVGSTKFHNNAETELLQPEVPQIRAVEEEYFDTRIFYDATGIATPVNYSDIVKDYENKGIWQSDVTSKTPFKFNGVLRDTPNQVPWLDAEAWVDTDEWND